MAGADSSESDQTRSATSLHAIAPAEPLQRTVALAGAVVEECRVQLSPDAVRIRAMDPATVAAVDLELGTGAFEEYETGAGEIGIDLERLASVLAIADDEDLVHLRLDAETRSLQVAFDELSYTLGLLDPAALRPAPDPIESKLDGLGEVVTTGATLDRGITAADMLSDHVAFAIDPDDPSFSIAAEGDTDDFTLTRSADDLRAIDPVDARSLFSVDYLRDVNREIPADAEVTVRVGREDPLIATFDVADGAGTAKYLVAPRIASR